MDISNIVYLLIIPLFCAGFQSGFHINCEACTRVKPNNAVDFIARFTMSSLYALITTVLPCLIVYGCEPVVILQRESEPVILNTIALGTLLVVIFVAFLMIISTIKAQVKNKWVKIIIPVILLIAAIAATLVIILLRIKI